MPRYSAPNNEDCAIDCTMDGWAIYIPPIGPCRTGCGPEDLFADSMLAIVKDQGWTIRTSASLRISGSNTAHLARGLLELSPNDDHVLGLLHEIDALGVQLGLGVFSVSWSETDVRGALERIRAALGGNSGSAIGTGSGGADNVVVVADADYGLLEE